MKIRIAAMVAFTVFMVFAAVQHNDPDAFGWALIYGYAALLSLMTALGVRVAVPALAGAMAYGLLAYRLFPGLEIPLLHIEEGRESLGLILCAVWSTGLGVTTLMPRYR